MRFDKIEWKSTSFGSSCDGFDYGIGAEAIAFDGNNQYIRITDIDDESSLYISKNLVSPSYIDENCIVKENDILFARTGASTGKTYLYNKNDGKLYFAGFLIRVNVKQSYDPYFIFTITKTNKFKNWVKIMSTRSGQPGINAQEYKKFFFKYPSLETQRKISTFIKKIDERILLQSKIIEDYEFLIKGIRYQIFNKNTLKSNNLINSKLGDFLQEYSERNIYNNLETVSVGKYGIRKREEIYSKDLTNDYSKNKVIRKNTLIIGMGSTQIDIGILSNDVNYSVSPAYTTYKINNINSKYLNEYLIYLNPLLSKRYMIIGARQGKSVNKSEMLLHNISIHKPNEQEKIVEIFDKLYNLQQKEKDILSLYKKQKAYLLQNMFI